MTDQSRRPIWQSLARGFRRRCPRCGKGASFSGYLTVIERCTHCREPLGEIRADDMPPYVTIFVVGHLVVPLVLGLERHGAPPAWLHFAIWPALTVVLTLALLPKVKGAVVGLMWALGLRGDERQ